MSASKLVIQEHMLPRKKGRQPLAKRRKLAHGKTVIPRRLDFGDVFTVPSDDDDESILADALSSMDTMDTPQVMVTPVSVANNEPKLMHFDLTSWRPCKLTYRAGENFFRLAHSLERDGTGSKKALNINLQQMRDLIDTIPQIDKAFTTLCESPLVKVDLLVHIGSKLHIKVHSPYKCVNIRVFEQGSSGLYPTSAGIALRVKELDKFKLIIPQLECVLDAAEVISCQHDNQLAEMVCNHCSPYPKQEEASFSDSDY